MDALVTSVNNLDDTQIVTETLLTIGLTHTDYNVKPSYFPVSVCMSSKRHLSVRRRQGVCAPLAYQLEYKNTIVVYLTKKSIHLCQHQYSVKL